MRGLLTGASVVLAAQVVSSCAAGPGPEQVTRDVKRLETRLDQPVEVRVGVTVEVGGEPITITFERVTEDSRCPTGVNCVWAGDATVRLRAEAPQADRAALDLHTHVSKAREADYRGYRIRLVQLVPWPKEGSTPSPDQYVATIVVSRGR